MRSYMAVLDVACKQYGKFTTECMECDHAHRCALSTPTDYQIPGLVQLIYFARCMGYELCMVPRDSVPECATVIDSLA